MVDLKAFSIIVEFAFNLKRILIINKDTMNSSKDEILF